MILVLDVGGTTTRIGVSLIGVKLDRHIEIETPAGRRGLHQVAEAAGRLLDGGKAAAVVLGLPATFTKEGRLHRLTNLPDWEGQDPRAAFAGLTIGGQVLADNDALMGALGEAYAGAGIIRGVMAYVTISTGINGARLSDGRPDPSAHYQIGDQLISWDPPQTLEELAGGRHIQERYGRLPSQVDDPALWEREIRVVAAGLHNLAVHWSPEVVVLGGSMMRDIPLALLEEQLHLLVNPYTRLPELRPAALGQLGGLHGALAYWRISN